MPNATEPTTLPPAPWHHAPCRHAARALLDAQLWCLGQDIRSPEGNLLVRYGAARDRAGLHDGQPSAYRWCGADGRRLVLWGHGVWVGDDASIGCYVHRKAFAPIATAGDWPAAHAFADGGAAARRRAPVADVTPHVGALCAWCAAYERWIAAVAPAGWRAHCEALRPRHVRRAARHAPCGTLAQGWATLTADWPAPVAVAA